MEWNRKQLSPGWSQNIYHTFLICGNSCLTNDRNFGKLKKKTEKDLPDGWIRVIKESRRAQPFKVVFVEKSHGLGFQEHFPQFVQSVYPFF